jgi:hypothetical protein
VAAAVAVLALGACSGPGSAAKGAAPATAGPASTPVAAASAATSSAAQSSQPGHGKALTTDQLRNAGLAASEMPQGSTLAGSWGPATSTAGPATGQPACQPLIQLVYASGPASSTLLAGYEDGADMGHLAISTYPLEQAQTFFAAVKAAVPACPAFTYSTALGKKTSAVTPLAAPGGGDDSVAFGLVRQGPDGAPVTDRYLCVRTGAGIVLLDQLGVPKPAPLPLAMLGRQVAKLQAAQG